MKTVLTIAGFDPSSGAGITADLMVFAAHGLFGTSAITALTVQSTTRVRASYPVDPNVLGQTLVCLSADIRPSGIKIGMLGSTSNIRIISKYIAQLKQTDSQFNPVPIILDTVLVSSSGRKLLENEGVEALIRELLPLADWVMPNANELEVLTGIEVRSREGLAIAARRIQKQPHAGRRERPLGIIAKGGHLEKPDDLVLTPDGEEHWLPGERIETEATHGTGCALSSAFLSRLVLGDEPVTAARQAKEYVAEAMRKAPGIGRGKGPMGLLWPLHGGPHH